MKFKKFSNFKPVTNSTRNRAYRLYEQDETNFEREESKEISVERSDVSKFMSKIFEARQMAHVYHLQVKGDMGSHAAHTALNEYYDALLGLLDELIETYTGQYDIISDYETIDTSQTKSKDKIEYFSEITQFIKEERKVAFSDEDTHLHNIIDEIVALTYKLLYKLKYNK